MTWIALLSWIGTASAQEAPAPASEPTQQEMDRALELYDNGKTLFAEASYRDAIAAWEESYRISKRSALLFNIANAHERLGQYNEAIGVLNRYRAFATAEERASIERRMRNLEKLQDEVDAAEKERQAVAPAPAPAPSPVQPAPVPIPKPAKKGVAGGTIAGVGLLVVGVGGLATGTALGLASKSAGKDAEASCNDGGLCSIDAKESIDSNQSLAAIADVAFIVGAAAAIGGVVVLVATPKAKVTMGVGSLHFDGRF